jgi:hypothetical protein
VTSRARKIAAAVLAAAGLGIAIWQLDGHYPIARWLVWPYLGFWLLAAGWALSCFSAGHAVLRRVPGLVLPLRLHLLFAFGCGVLAFVIGLFLIGVLHGLRPATFVLWPLALLASGARPLAGLARRALRHLRHARRRPGLGRASPAGYALFLFGALGVVALYLNIITPSNIAYDVRWYHFGIAEHYVAAHAITRFPEGWFAGALPQLASLVYTWAFLLPASTLFSHVELAVHLEFVLLLATLAGLPLLVRWLVAEARNARALSLSWTAFFLFPGIFVYDSAPSGAADHVLAFWAAPLVLAAARFCRGRGRGDGFLLAVMAAGAALTKYQALYLLAPVGIAVGFRVARAAWKRRSLRDVAPGVLVAGGTFAALTSIHWLKNLIWYGDPVYPLLYEHLKVRPWNPDADTVVTVQAGGFKLTGSFGHRLAETLHAVGTFGFEAHDWGGFHRDWPTFGFLFLLLLPITFVIKGAWRMRALALGAWLGVFIWYWTFHEDRYLQSLTPWMAAVVAAVIWSMWRSGWAGRVAIAPLVALQIFWGGDHYAFPTHAMTGQQPMRLSMDMIAGGFLGRFEERFAPPSNLVGIGKSLPKGARVLIHEQHLRLGIGVPSVTDARGTQGALSYRRARSPRDLWQQLRALGVTHVMWAAPIGLEAYGDEAVFYDFVRHHLGPASAHDGWTLAPLPASPPSDRPYGPVALQGCSVAHRVSLPEVDRDIWVASPIPGPAEMPALQRGVDFVLIEGSCRDRYPGLSGFNLVTSRNGWETWSRPH